MALKDFLGKNPMNSDRKDQPNKSDPEGNVPKPDGKGILNRISSIVLPALIIFLVVVAASIITKACSSKYRLSSM